MSLIRILLADDHVMVREGTRQILEREPDLVVVAEASNGREAIDLAAREAPDVAVVDISMPVMNGIEATKGIKHISPRTAVLVLTAYDDDQYVYAILRAGAAGYLLKNARGKEIAEAVRRVYEGEPVLHPSILEKVIKKAVSGMITEQVPQAEVGAETLSERELEVLRAAARGLSNREIAEELILSPYTVQNHMKSIFGKLQVGSRTEAVMVGLRSGWLTLGDVSES
ncbi:MAG: DNA-binding response regulator [Chloroflexi bacterium RBG_13_56_8]|nr:MAG: DNA-binding response regulator [Chloroflexi bacterium RBG_13_56_8]